MKNKIYRELTQTSKNEEKDKLISHINTSNNSSIFIGIKNVNNSAIENSSNTANEFDAPMSANSSQNTNNSRIENFSKSESSYSNGLNEFFGDLSNKFAGSIIFLFTKQILKNSYRVYPRCRLGFERSEKESSDNFWACSFNNNILLFKLTIYAEFRIILF